MKTETLIKKLLNTAPCNWQAIVEKHALKMPKEERDKIAGTMEDMAGRLSYLAEYTNLRAGQGICGTGANHKEAARMASIRCVKVNRALGYTYPDRRTFNL